MMEEKKRGKGRPFLYDTPEELEADVEAYFREGGPAWVKGSEGGLIYQPTMAGLALHLGVDRKTVVNYGDKEEFSHIVKRARTRVEVALEQRLYSGQPAGVIFNLKNNFGWSDKHEIDHQSGDGSMTPRAGNVSIIELVGPEVKMGYESEG